MLGRRVEPAGVDREQEEREDERRHDHDRLPRRAQDRAPGEVAGLRGKRLRCRVAGTITPPPRTGSARSAVVGSAGLASPAPSSERPVLARKTSSRLGAWSCRSATLIPSASSARITSASSSVPSASRTAAAPRREAGSGSPNRASTASSASSRLGVGGDRLDRRPADLGLQLRRGALGDELAAVDDPDPVGERVGLLEVLGGEEDRHAVRRGPGARPRPRAPTGSGCRARSSARRGTGAAARGSAPARGRGGASSRPSSRRPGGRPPRRARPARAARRRGARSRRVDRP